MTPTGKRNLWLLALRQRSVWWRTVKFGLPVGFLQAAVNQGDVWLHQSFSAHVVLKSFLSPLISCTLVLFTSAATWVRKTMEDNNA